MSTTMRILGWKAEGLRCPDHEINCCRDDGQTYRVSLIQMPNGTGKTTTLQLLRAAISGSAAADRWSPSAVKELKKRGSDNSHGSFVLRLLLDRRRVTVIMAFDFEAGKISYKTTRGHGQVNGFDPPHDFRRFMNDNFAKFFVFDGELAQDLLDRDQVQADSVLEALFQISAIRSISAKIQTYWDESTRHVSATEERGLARRQNRLKVLRDRLAYLEGERNRLISAREERASNLERQRQRYDQEIKKEEARAQRIASATARVEKLEAAVREDSLEILETLRDPHAVSSVFAEMLQNFKLGLDRVKLPESAAREFFEELADELECVCGRMIDDDIRAVIRSRANGYLGSDDVSLLNSMKTLIFDAVGPSSDRAEKDLRKTLGELDDVIANAREAQNELESLRLEAEAEPAVRRAKEKIEELEEAITNTDALLERFESKEDTANDSDIWGIEVVARRLKDAEDKLAEITRTIRLKVKRDILVTVIEVAYQRGRDGIARDVCAQANERIAELLPYNQIVIDRVDQCLILSGQEGGSVGENLSVAYAFLATLFNRSEHQLPFVVDSPAGPIDLAVRPKIGELIPKLTGQFIAFTISSERENFVPGLKQASGGDIQFLTVFRKGSEALEGMGRATSNFLESSDGFVVHDEALFNNFQLDSEDA
jgi:DNA sulfur modification protein DndD